MERKAELIIIIIVIRIHCVQQLMIKSYAIP